MRLRDHKKNVNAVVPGPIGWYAKLKKTIVFHRVHTHVGLAVVPGTKQSIFTTFV